MSIQEIKLPPVPDATVRFKMGDRMYSEAYDKTGEIKLMTISGYDLRFEFNMEHLRTMQDIEAAKTGIANMFANIITGILLEHTDLMREAKKEAENKTKQS